MSTARIVHGPACSGELDAGHPGTAPAPRRCRPAGSPRALARVVLYAMRSASPICSTSLRSTVGDVVRYIAIPATIAATGRATRSTTRRLRPRWRAMSRLASRASTRVDERFTRRSRRPARIWPSGSGRHVGIGGRARLVDHPAVAQEDHPIGPRGVRCVMRHEDRGAATVAVGPKEPHDGLPGDGVERARRLVREHDRRPPTRARAIATRCCSPPERSSGNRFASSPRPTD